MISRTLCLIFAVAAMALIAGVGCAQLDKVTDDLKFEYDKPSVLTSDGAPAESASVSIVPVDYLPLDNDIIYETTTDSNGQFDLPPMDDGLYNVIVRQDSFIAVQDSVYISESQPIEWVDNFTLSPSVGFAGFVKMQPGHDPRSVTVQMYGWDTEARNVGVDGIFTYENYFGSDCPYFLLLTSTEEGYTPTYVNVFIKYDYQDVAIDTIEMIYTGIPQVTNLYAWFDSSTGNLEASWDGSTYRYLYDYAVFFEYGNYSSPFTQIKNMTPTCQTQPWFSMPIDGWYYGWGFDTWVYSYEEDFSMFSAEQKAAVTVAIRDGSLETGALCKPVEVTYHQLAYYQPRFVWSMRNGTKAMDFEPYSYYDISTGDSLALTISAFDHGLSIVSMTLKDLSFISRKVTKKAPADCHNFSATLKTSAPEINDYKRISCSVLDDAGKTWCDTVEFYVYEPYAYSGQW